jgi:hypothetical protein
MHLASRIHRPPETLRTAEAEALLGGEHPLVIALERRAVAMAQLVAVLGVLSVSLVGVVVGARGAVPVAVAGAGVTAVMGCRLAVRASEVRDCVWELIIGGRGEFALPLVERERTRLSDPTVRDELAHAYESMSGEPDAFGLVPCRACVVGFPSVMAKVRPELALVAALLRDDAASVRGVAAAQRFLCDGTSSLFGRDDVILCQDLHRIAYLLCDHEGAGGR